MNTVKKTLKTIALTGLALMVTTEIQSAVQTQKDKIMMGIVSNHTRVFGVDDLFKGPIDFGPWNSMVQEAQNFVTANAKSDKALMGQLNQTIKLSTDLVNFMQMAYTALSTQKGFSDYINKFKSLSSQATQIENSVKKASFVIQSKKDAQDVLVQLAMFVGTTANAASNHLAKKKPAAPARKPGQAPQTPQFKAQSQKQTLTTQAATLGGAAAQARSKGLIVRKKTK